MLRPFIETHDVISAFPPVDLQTAANNGDYICLKNWHGCAVIFFSSVGTAGDDATLTLQQADTVAGGNVKALTKITTVYHKQGALLTAVEQFTKVTQTAASTYTDLLNAELQCIWVIDVNTADLDLANGFDCIRANIADVGTNAQLGCMLYIPYGPRYGQAIVATSIA